MKIFILAILFSTVSFAQLQSFAPPTQDSPDIHWKKIENENFKIIYPDFLEKKANYILNLLEYFHAYVAQSYNTVPRKFTLIIRSQMSSPNGFVTLAPRRSEWFSSTALTPMVGSLDWYQSLAIHEYRHVVQMDYLKRPHVDVGYALFGEFGLMLFMNWITPGWFFEGDAVYAETKYTDAGRGRSPRFLARMKALVASENIPTYDQFLAGDYTNSIPNHYAYGYLLITRAYQEFGEDVWAKIMSLASRRVYNPWAIYGAFEDITGVSFANFYRETMDELREKWNTKIVPSEKLYTRIEYPIVDQGATYYLRKDLDSFWTLMQKKGKQEQKIAEFNIIPSMSRVDVKKKKFIYSIAFSDPRYQYKGHSDLYIYDINLDTTYQITNNKRFYHPQLHPKIDEIMAIEFDEKNNWSLSFLNFSGEVKNRISFPGYSITEAIYLDEQSIGAIVIDELGYRSIAKINLSNKSLDILTKPSRSNLFAINKGENSILFEGDYQGKVNIFEVSTLDKSLRQCTDEQIAAYRPHKFEDKILYTSEVANGTKLVSREYQCAKVEQNFLDHYQYLGKGPSDNLTNSAPKPFELTKSELTKVNADSDNYNTLDGAMRPHSWSFIGRGFQLGVYAQNMLSTLYWSAAVGHSSVEARPYGNFSLSYAKYFPIFTLNLDYADRKVKYEKEQVTSTWSEALAGVDVSLPLIYQRNLYTQQWTFTVGASSLAVSEKEVADPYEPSREQLAITTSSIVFSNLKETTYRQLIPSWGQKLSLYYKNALATQEESFSSYMSFVRSTFYLPGFFHNDGLRLVGSYENHKDDINSYRFTSPAQSPTTSIYSRGYTPGYYPQYNKWSLDYYYPIGYPNEGFRDYIYFNRVYGKLFYDYTSLNGKDNDLLRSVGNEFHFESLTFRKLPLIYSFRIYYKLDAADDESDGGVDFYLGTNFAL